MLTPPRAPAQTAGRAQVRMTCPSPKEKGLAGNPLSPWCNLLASFLNTSTHLSVISPISFKSPLPEASHAFLTNSSLGISCAKAKEQKEAKTIRSKICVLTFFIKSLSSPYNTAPAEIPLIICFCIKRYTRIIGAAVMHKPAINKG